jgi:hypothetical protein
LLFYISGFNKWVRVGARNPYRRGRLSTANLLELTSLDQLLFILKILFTLFYKTRYLNKEVNSTGPSTKFSVPWLED